MIPSRTSNSPPHSEHAERALAHLALVALARPRGSGCARPGSAGSAAARRWPHARSARGSGTAPLGAGALLVGHAPRRTPPSGRCAAPTRTRPRSPARPPRAGRAARRRRARARSRRPRRPDRAPPSGSSARRTQKSRLPWASVHTTGVPAAIASSGGRQKPSCLEVCTNTAASLKQLVHLRVAGPEHVRGVQALGRPPARRRTASAAGAGRAAPTPPR